LAKGDEAMKYGCHNRKPYKEPHRMSPDCEYTKTELGKVDERCAGCRWKIEEPLPERCVHGIKFENRCSLCDVHSEDIQIDEWNGLTDKHKVVLIREALNWTTLQLIEEVETMLKGLNK
jgi:hypothetical protein